MVRALLLASIVLAGCSSGSDDCAELRGEQCSSQLLECRVEACTHEGAAGSELTTGNFTFPSTVLHVRTKATIEFDQLFVGVTKDMRSQLPTLDVKVNGVATTPLAAEPDHPERLRYAIPRILKGESVDVQMSSPESIKFTLRLVDTTVTCQLCTHGG